jgi:predicted phosphodiesterase
MKYTKIAICTDSHGDKRNARAVKLFKQFVDEEFKPEIRLHLGDWMNAEAFRNGADERERRVGLKQDKREAFEFLEWYKPTHLLDGNHDYRLPTYVKHSPGPLADYVSEILDQADSILAKFKTRHLPYHKRDGVLRLGKMKALHGFFAGMNAPQQHARAFGSCVFGHTHRFSAVSVPGAHSGDRAVARGIGCLCELDMDYNALHVDTLSQAQGWAYGVMDERGRYWLANAEIVEGKVAIYDEFKILG